MIVGIKGKISKEGDLEVEEFLPLNFEEIKENQMEMEYEGDK